MGRRKDNSSAGEPTPLTADFLACVFSAVLRTRAASEKGKNLASSVVSKKPARSKVSERQI